MPLLLIGTFTLARLEPMLESAVSLLKSATDNQTTTQFLEIQPNPPAMKFGDRVPIHLFRFTVRVVLNG